MYMFAYPKKLIHAGANEGSPETKGGANDVVIQLMKTKPEGTVKLWMFILG